MTATLVCPLSDVVLNQLTQENIKALLGSTVIALEKKTEDGFPVVVLKFRKETKN